MAAELDRGASAWARAASRSPRASGSAIPAPDGRHLLAVDDPGLDPLFERAGALGMPVAIHIGDPKAFWKPVTPENERWDELRVHPEWSFCGPGIPSWQQLYDAFERLVARHPKTTFIGVHFGNDPEDPDNVARMLDKYPNLYIDTAARVPEIGRHPQEKMRRFYAKYQDRILFGTDTGIGADDDDMMYGSNGAGAADPRRRGPLLHVDLALLRDARPPVREPDADPGPLEDRRRRPARVGAAQDLLRERGARPALAAAGHLTPPAWRRGVTHSISIAAA